MRTTIMLADAVQTADNKLYVLGAGWAFTGPQVSPMGVGVIVEVAWHEANEPHTFRLELQDPDGMLVALGDGGDHVRIEGSVEVGRPAGHPVGVPFNVPLAFNFGPLPLPAGSRYVWAFYLDGAEAPDATVGFNTRR